MKTIKKFWGVAFILVLLSTLLVGAVPQAAAGNYAFTADTTLPSAVNRVLAPAAGWGAIDMAQVGNTILITGKAGAGGANSIYRSTDGGVTWAPLTATGLPAANAYLGLVAMAPDNTNIIAVVDTQVMPNIIYLSNNGGNTFTAITATLGYVKGIAISPVLNGTNRLTIAGNTQGRNPVRAYQGFLNTWQIGSVSPAWAAIAGAPAVQDFCGVTYSTNFNADQAMLVVTHNSTANTTVSGNSRGLTRLHVYSFNTNAWDALVDNSYPRTLYQGAATLATNGVSLSDNVSVCGAVKFALDPNFYMGDSAAQIGFLTVNISSNATGAVAAVGGLYRLNASTTTAIKAAMAFNGVAWDGTNVMASQNGTFNAIASGTPIWRCANALTTSPSVLVNTTVKAPATGNNTRLFFASGVGYAASSGGNGGIAKTTDYGKSWNGFRLLNTNLNTVLDWWVSPDASRVYATTNDSVDINLWRKSGSTWERVLILPAVTGQLWMVRADADVPDTVYLGRSGAVNMWKSLDGGEYSWSPRACSQLIQDFAVQDADTLYVAIQGATNMVKSTQGAFTWGGVTATGLAAGGGNCYSITLIGDNQALIGGTGGGVAYTADGATWTRLGGNMAVGGNVVATANGLATGNVIWGASSAGGAGSIASWTLGTNTTTWTAAGAAPLSADGIAYANGVVYVYEDNGLLVASVLHRFLRPTVSMAAANADAINVGVQVFLNDQTVNAIQVATSGVVNTVWGRQATLNAADAFRSYSDYLATAENVPTPIYPINNAIIPINSISGIINAFVFQWNAPPALSTVVGYSFDLQVYIDAAGTIVVGSNVGANAVANGGTVAAAGSGLGLLGGAALAMQPGTTYYWRVRTATILPVLSNWSAMQTYVVQQLTAIVPVIASPANGGEVNTQNPAFSWSPIANATSYTFELALDADFTNVVYTVDPTSAGAAVPSTIKLTRGLQYFWRVKTLTPMEGEWSAVANFIVAELPPVTPTTPQVTITTAPQPTIIISQPPVTTTQTQIVVPPPEVTEVNPSYIWAIIIVGAVLVIAVIVLIVRTRRSV